jgi:phage major head subunit gpT-like protein
MPQGYSPPVAQELNVRLVQAFDEGVQESAENVGEVMDLAFVNSSDTAANVYLFASRRVGMQRRPALVDTFKTRGINVYEQKIENDGDVYDAIEIDVYKYDDDKIGEYLIAFYQLGADIVFWTPEELERLVLDSENIVCYDGSMFFAEDHHQIAHNKKSPTWKNLLYEPTGLDFDSFDRTVAHMRLNIPREDGNSYRSEPTALVCGPDIAAIGADIVLNPEPKNYPGRNMRAGKYRLIVLPNMKGEDWMLCDLRYTKERPWIWQERTPLRLEDIHTTPDDPEVKKHKKYVWQVRGRVVGGVGYPQRAVKVKKAPKPAKKLIKP